MKLGELIDQAIEAAQAGLEPQQAAFLDDAEVLVQSLLRTVFRKVDRDCAADPRKRSLLRREKTIALTNGVGTLPEEVITRFMDESSVRVVDDESNIGGQMSYLQNWIDLTQTKDTRCGYYAIRGQRELWWVDPGSTFSFTTGRNSQIGIFVPCYTTIPADADSDIDADPEWSDAALLELTQALLAQDPDQEEDKGE